MLWVCAHLDAESADTDVPRAHLYSAMDMKPHEPETSEHKQSKYTDGNSCLFGKTHGSCFSCARSK